MNDAPEPHEVAHAHAVAAHARIRAQAEEAADRVRARNGRDTFEDAMERLRCALRLFALDLYLVTPEPIRKVLHLS